MQRLAMVMVALMVVLGASPAFTADPGELDRLIPGVALEQDELKQFYGRGTVSSSSEGSIEASHSGNIDMRLLMRARSRTKQSFAAPRTPSGRNAARGVFGIQIPKVRALELERTFEFFESISTP